MRIGWTRIPLLCLVLSHSSCPTNASSTSTSSIVPPIMSVDNTKTARLAIPAAIAGALSVLWYRYSQKQNSNNNRQYPLETIQAASSERDQFMALYPMLRDEILAQLPDSFPEEAVEWCRNVIDYNVPGGKLNRGMTVVTVYQALLHRPLRPFELAQAAVLGWAIEFLQAFFLVADDVMDESQTRRGQPCWYKQPHVGLIAINDSFLLESFVFSILKTHFGRSACYPDLVELLLNVIHKTELGQLLDLTSQPSGNAIDLDRFTWERYRQIVRYKTAYYTFYLPIAMGMILSGVTHRGTFEQAERICCDMGEYFQIQDDVLDCFGDPAVIGKVGTDIQDNKCSWLVVQALQRCNATQRQVLQDNYGQWDDNKVAAIKALYEELELKQAFEQYEEESYARIQAQLDQVKNVPRQVFEVLLHKIYKRSK